MPYAVYWSLNTEYLVLCLFSYSLSKYNKEYNIC
jgi:hypothetical protein